jgi:hypothetical protein
MKLRGKIKQAWTFITDHKWALTIAAFAIWMVCIDKYDLREQHKLRQKIHSLTEEKQFYTEKIQEDSVMLYELKTNDNNLEKYAREQFFMKANDEDVFEIVETE